MVIGKRVKILREQKNMCQGDIQKRTGLLRCYISRVENGHTVPSVDTLERLAGSSAANPDVPAFYRRRTGEEAEPTGRSDCEPGGQLKNRNARFERSPNAFHAWIIGSVNF